MSKKFVVLSREEAHELAEEIISRLAVGGAEVLLVFGLESSAPCATPGAAS